MNNITKMLNKLFNKLINYKIGMILCCLMDKNMEYKKFINTFTEKTIVWEKSKQFIKNVIVVLVKIGMVVEEIFLNNVINV